MNKSTKDFVAMVDLPEGSHEYKFLVDGKWVNDKNGNLADNEPDERGGRRVEEQQSGISFQLFFF